MANKLFQETQNNSLMGNVQQIKSNPVQYLMQRKLNIPPEYASNPQEAANYLVQSGQVSQERMNWAMQMANQMGIKLR